MSALLVLWDIDGTLLNSGGVGRDLYDMVFVQLFGRSLDAFAPMAGRTDRSIILETLTMAGVSEPRRHVDPFIAGMSAQVPLVRSAMTDRGRAMPGAAAALAALAALRSSGASAAAAVTVTAAAKVTAAVTVTAATATPSAATAAAGASGADTAAEAVGTLVSMAPARPLATRPRPERVYQSVLTGNIRTVAEAKLAALGLREPLDLCIGAYGDDHEVRAELVHVARRRAAAVHGRSSADFAGPSTVVVGDTPLDIEAALATGARAIGVATGAFSRGDLTTAGAHAVLSDLTDTAAVLHALLG